jgi:hypothetical protein
MRWVAVDPTEMRRFDYLDLRGPHDFVTPSPPGLRMWAFPDA